MESEQDFGFLTDQDIQHQSDHLFKEGYNPNEAKRAAYDLHLGEYAYLTGSDYPQKLSEKQPFISIPRGQFALLITKEYVTMPKDYLGLISTKFGFKEQGLINVSGFHVDPGFHGKILFSVFNAGPMDVVLEYDKPTFMLFFYKLHKEVGNPYNGERQGQTHLPTNIVTSLKGSSASLSDVDKRVSQLETTTKVYWAVLIALIGALVAVFLKYAM